MAKSAARGVLTMLGLAVLGPTARAQQPPPIGDVGARSLIELSIEELMNVEVVTATRTVERVFEAPATVMVITKQEMDERGYVELSQIFDDLPGMDVVRPYGSSYLKLQWRGWQLGFLVMIDGVIFNHLYFNSTETPLATMPLGRVKQVEVVYGPASSVYGANASMGVINIITENDPAADGSYATARLFAGSNMTRIVDASYLYKRGDFRVSVSARIDNGKLDERKNGFYEYTKDEYYADRRLWGGFLDNPSLAGRFESGRRNRALDARAYLGGTEVAAQFLRLDTGYGLEYAADKVQNNAIWARTEYSLYARRTDEYGDKLTSSTLLRYRSSNVENDSFFVDAFFDKKLNQYVAAMSYWQSLNFSWIAAQDFEARPFANSSFNFGLKYEQKNLNKAYDLVGEASDPMAPGGYVPVSMLDASKYNYPRPPDAARRAENRITTEDFAGYLQARYRRTGLFGASDYHQLTGGVRLDHNSQYDNAWTFRTGYVGHYGSSDGSWGAKLLFGQGFQEPIARQLYGGWKGSGSDPDLKPQKSRTLEGSVSYTARHWSALVDAYDVETSDIIETIPGGAKNVGSRTLTGIDLHLQALVPVTARSTLRIWSYYCQFLRVREQKFDKQGNPTHVGRIGDLADTKIFLGFTGTYASNLIGTLRGRFIGERPTVDTNPIRSVDRFVTMDASLLWRNFLFQGIGVSVNGYNLLNKTYFHPGTRAANAGNTPGAFDAMGVWHGSAGYDSSILPQPGRTVLVSLDLQM